MLLVSVLPLYHLLYTIEFIFIVNNHFDGCGIKDICCILFFLNMNFSMLLTLDMYCQTHFINYNLKTIQRKQTLDKIPEQLKMFYIGDFF